jgi:hypothetical protein
MKMLAVAAAVFLTAVSLAASPGGERRTMTLNFPDATGVLGVVSTHGFDTDNPFFQPLGSNGRSCVTCHRPADGWSINPSEVQERFERTNGFDPIFRTNDGSNCEGADVSTLRDRRRAFSLLLRKGLIRVALDVPAGAEFDIIDVDDPYHCGAPLTTPSLYRRPLPSANLPFLSAVMWDGRESLAGQAIRDGLITQASDAVIGHAQGAGPSRAQLDAIVDFELGLYSAQEIDHAAGSLSHGDVRGGARALAREPFCIGINDPLDLLPAMPGACPSSSGGLNPLVFTMFRDWTAAASRRRLAIARGEAIFNTRHFVIDDVPGLNGKPGDPVGGPIVNGTCSLCHDTPNVGNHSVAMALNIGVSDASRRTRDLPLYTLRNRASGETVQTTDPGRAMVTGRWNDIGKFKGPILRGLAARAPYFHNGSAATLSDVIELYDGRFKARFTDQEKADLLAFLQSL